jgi:Na+-driven multidrug efflux pump
LPVELRQCFRSYFRESLNHGGLAKSGLFLHLIFQTIQAFRDLLYILPKFFQKGVYYAWICTTTFVASLFILSSWRYRQGKWQKMLVVEKAMVASSPDESFLRVRP